MRNARNKVNVQLRTDEGVLSTSLQELWLNVTLDPASRRILTELFQMRYLVDKKELMFDGLLRAL